MDIICVYIKNEKKKNIPDYWMNMISFTLHKTIASQIIVQSTKFNGHHSLSPYATSYFPDSTDIHFDMND